jgi:hypothetical protein
VGSWDEPTVHWQSGVDSLAHHRHLRASGELLTTWPPAPFEETATDCFKVGLDYWIWQPGVGGIRFAADRPECTAFPANQVDREAFERQVARSWLPAVYLVWGRQVLHASAVARHPDGRVIAFSGPSGAGKSTMAYGLTRRPGWQLVCDDTLAFSCPPSGIALHALRNDARLRPASAAHFGKAGDEPEPVSWPAIPLEMTAIYFLEGEPGLPEPIVITPLKAAESYVRLLEQAHAFTLKIPQHNQRLMRDYLTFAARVPAFRLSFLKSFAGIERVFADVEHHAATVGAPDAQQTPEVLR